nr:hypothetical protein [Neisseriaceae bacterium]
ANFQPTIILPLIIGKFSAGAIAIFLAYKLSVPAALVLAEQDKLNDRHLGDETQEQDDAP